MLHSEYPLHNEVNGCCIGKILRFDTFSMISRELDHSAVDSQRNNATFEHRLCSISTYRLMIANDT